MNEEAREAAWLRWAKPVTHPPTANADIHFKGGWDAGRTFSTEDVERVAEVVRSTLIRRGAAFPRASVLTDALRAALAAIGTVEEAQ